MRDPGVDQDEMNLIRRLSEAEAERLWEGNPPAGKGMDELAGFFRELRQANAAEPGPELESAHLQAIMAEVSRVRSARPAQTEAPPAAAGRPARRGLNALGLKLAAAGLGAVMLMGGLAAADVLPDPVQKVVSRVGEVVTPFNFPEPPGSRSEFGENVSRDAKDPADPGVSGKEVSEDAKSRGADKPAGPDPAVLKPAHPAPPAPPANPGRGQGQANRARPEAPGAAHRPAPGQTGQPPKGNVGVDPPGGPAGAGISSGSGGGPASGRGSGSAPPGPDAPGS